MDTNSYHYVSKLEFGGSILDQVTDPINIVSSVLEIDLYEDVLNPYVHGTISIIDSFGFRNAINFKGTETVTLEITEQLTESSQPRVVVSKKFYVSRIEATAPVNDRTDVVLIHIVEDHVIVNAVKQISKSYTGHFEEMIAKIIRTELQKPVAFKNYEPSAQGARKVVVPYLNPIEAIIWLRDRATSPLGFPMLTYSTLYSEDIVIESMEKNLKTPVLNLKNPLRYTKDMRTSDNPAEEMIYNIEGYKDVNSENVINMIESGTIGSRYSSTDLNTGATNRRHFSVRNVLDEIYVNDIINGNFIFNIFDPVLKIGDFLYDEYDSLNVHQVNTGNTYSQFRNYHDESVAGTSLKYKQNIIKNIMNRNTVDINMNGFLFFAKNISVANKLRLMFLNSDASDNSVDLKKSINQRRSGDYVITAIRHSINKSSHRVVFSCSKIKDFPEDALVIS